MPLHLLKLCVGCDSIQDLEDWITGRVAHNRSIGHPGVHTHVTRMVPRRTSELAGGSLYWVIKGQIACRQPLIGVEPFTDADGIGRCRLLLERTVIPVTPRPCRAFQGWRYLTAESAPPDLDRSVEGAAVLPEALRRELAELGLI